MDIRPVFGFLLSLLTAIMWGVLPLFMKLAFEHMDAITVSFYRFVIAFLFVLALSLVKKELPTLQQFSQRRWLLILFTGIALTVNYLTYAQGLDYLDPESAQVLIQFAPFLLMIGGIWLFNELFTKLQMLGATILLTGFVLFFDGKWQVLFASLGQYTIGVILIMVAAITWAVYALLQKSLFQHFTAGQMTLLMYGFGCLFIFPLASVYQISDMTWLSGLSLLFCGFNTIIAYGCFTKALSIWEASKVSAVIALAPIFTILSTGVAVAWFPELFSPSDLTQIAYLGAFLVVIGSMVTALGKAHKVSP